MSGFIAVLQLDGHPVERALLQEMTGALAFRGPDALRTWCDEAAPIGLGHALLQTNEDTAPEQQPRSLDGVVWLAADVRLDARPELLERLRVAGTGVADDATDPEVVLHAHRLWGDEFVAHLAGDFAFALWDGRRRRLVCARDHFGVAPLYWARVGNTVVCSNTLDAVRRHPAVSNTLNELAIADQMLFGGNQDWATTTLRDVQRVPPAHRLVCADGAPRVERYWQGPAAAPDIRYRRPGEYVEHFRELLDRATADRLRTRRAGILMSGGLDSTAIAAAAKRGLAAGASAYDLRAYTWVYRELLPDEEGSYATLAAAALGIPLELLTADDDTLDYAPGVRLSPLQRVASYGRVMLSGFGGDPLLHPDFGYWLRRLRHGQLGRLASEAALTVRLLGRRPPLYLRQLGRRWRGQPLWRPSFPTWVRADFAARTGLRARIEQVTDDWLSDRTRTGMVSPFWSNLFANRDPDHTRVAVRMRHPFFDLRLLDFALRIPAVPWFVNKEILRAALQPDLPDSVRLRPKTPMATWPHHRLVTRHGVPPWMADLAATPELASYVDLSALRECLHAPEQVADHEYQAVVRVVALAAWLRRAGLCTAPAT